MRTAVLLFGLVQRSLRHVAGELRDKLLEPASRRGAVEVFFHSWITGPLNNPRAGEIGAVNDPGDIARFLPEAAGEFDNEADFLANMEWSEIESNNPFRRANENEAAANVTIRNIICTLQSLERVWKIHAENSEGPADCVIATRADIRFLMPLALPPELPRRTVFIPTFHGWGGLNDRFAYGHPEAMEVYARRRHFFEGSLLHAHRHNPEWVLKKWLDMRMISVEGINFAFQRIRADGSVFHLDRELATCRPTG